MKYLYLIILVSFITSCARLTPSHTERSPSNVDTLDCMGLVNEILNKKNSVDSQLLKVLQEKSLLSFKNKLMTLELPKIEWFNDLRNTLNNKLKNFNNNKYPTFYTLNDEDIIPIAKNFADSFIKMTERETPLDRTSLNNLQIAHEWISRFSSYQEDLNKLLDHKISLQYNIDILKKLKLESGIPNDIVLTILRDGIPVKEVVTLRKEDGNLKLVLEKLINEAKELDGGFIKSGKIQERVTRQAMLFDMLSILHRELEYQVKNSDIPNEALVNEFSKIDSALKSQSFKPSSYGTYKIDNKIMLRELSRATKADVAIDKIVDAKNAVTQFITDPNTKKKVVELLQSIYSPISSLTPKQKWIAGGVVVIGGISAQRYFSFSKVSVTEVTEKNQSSAVEIEEPMEQAELVQHEQQLNRTHDVINKYNEEVNLGLRKKVDELLQ